VKITRPLVALVPVALLLLAACGGDDDDESMAGDEPESSGGESTPAERTVDVQMVDNAFEPTNIDVEAGETVKLMFDNTGEVAHDALVGDAEAQAAHEEEMRAAEDMGHGAENDDAITVEPGDTGELVYTFDEPGALEIGCHEAGHYASGMTIDVTVS
jgi:uncharacterized cupredoxin-like copper-binding protein